jgi:ElaB/YqjD/DUF883 family membrane-anchored ribosome-binding protein
MNATTSLRELGRIRRDIGVALRIEQEAAEPASQSLTTLLKDLETRVLDAERERLFAEVDVRVAELIHVAGRSPQDRCVASSPAVAQLHLDNLVRELYHAVAVSLGTCVCASRQRLLEGTHEMDQKSSRPETQAYPGHGSGSSIPKPNSVGDALSRGRDALGDAASDAARSTGSDLEAIQNDLNSLKETLSRFVSQAGTQAVKSARDATSNLAGQVGDVAGDLADRGSKLVSTAGDQAKTFASELETMARRNPLGTLAGAVAIGVLIGIMGRRS